MPMQTIGTEEALICPSYDQSANDQSGNTRNASLSNGAAIVSDVSNGGTHAIEFDGSNDFAAIPSISLSGAWSVSAWFKVLSHGDYSTLFAFQNMGSSDFEPGFYADVLDDGSHKLGIWWESYDGGSAAHPTSQVVTANTWYHLAAVFNSGTLSYYINGSLLESGSFSGGVVGTSGITLARQTSFYGNIRLDDLRVFDVAISTANISNLASSRCYEPGGSGQTVSVGYTEEENESLSVDVSKTLLTVIEENASLAVSVQKNIEIGLAPEEDGLLDARIIRVANVGFATEESEALESTVTHKQVIFPGVATEEDATFDIDVEKDQTLSVGIVQEASESLPVVATTPQTISVGFVSQQEEPLGIEVRSGLVVPAGLVVELNEAKNVSVLANQIVQLGICGEFSEALDAEARQGANLMIHQFFNTLAG